jgi:hypothetical protein
MPNLILSPINGFGNRLRAMASGCILAESLGRTFYVHWNETKPNDKFYIPPFDSVFQDDCIPKINHIPENATLYEGGHHGEQQLIPSIMKDKSDSIIIRAGGLFIPHGMSHKQYNKKKSEFYKRLHLRPEIQLIVDQFIIKHFKDQQVLGVHIRRSDRKMYTGPTTLFIDKIRQSKFDVIFLCTDDPSEEIHLGKYFNIIQYSKSKVARCSTEQFIDAVIDWYLLSNTNRIIYSKGSSFGYEACFLNQLYNSTPNKPGDNFPALI